MDERSQGYRATVRQIILTVALVFVISPFSSSATPRLAELKAAAEAGDAQAQDNLAEAYRRTFDHTNATFWYRRAAAQGIANSQYQLAQTLIYEATSPLVQSGSKTDKAAEGLELLKRAARQGHTRAQLFLGRVHQEGKVALQDYVEAYTWFAIAGRGGPLDPPAMEGRTCRDQLIPKMSQAEIAEGEARASRFIPGTATSGATAPSYISQLRLQGISGPSKRRLAIINGESFEAGEAGTVKLAGFRIYLACESITTNSANVVLQETGMKVLLQFGKAPVVQSPPVRVNQPGMPKSPPAVQPQPPPARKPPATRPAVPAPPPPPKAPDPFAPTKKTLRVLAWIPAIGGIAVSLAILGIVVAIPLLRRNTKRSAPTTANLADVKPPILSSVQPVQRTSDHPTRKADQTCGEVQRPEGYS